MDVADLRQKLDHAFGSVEVPRFLDLLAPRFGNSIDPLELAAALRGKHWRDVPPRDLFVHRESLAALSGVGFRAHIAGYLIGALDEREESADLAEYVLFSLHPIMDTPREVDEARERLSQLDDVQRAAIRAWLEYQQQFHARARDLLPTWT